MWKLCDLNAGKSKELKLVFSETLQKIMDENPNVIALEADLGGASSFLNIKKTHPDQFLDVGIAEANMIGTAAGLSMLGYILLSLFLPFASRRVEDQVFLAGAYSKNTINIYSSDPGVCAATNGGTHTSFEDLAFMRLFQKLWYLIRLTMCSLPGLSGNLFQEKESIISVQAEKLLPEFMKTALLLK